MTPAAPHPPPVGASPHCCTAHCNPNPTQLRVPYRAPPQWQGTRWKLEDGGNALWRPEGCYGNWCQVGTRGCQRPRVGPPRPQALDATPRAPPRSGGASRPSGIQASFLPQTSRRFFSSHVPTCSASSAPCAACPSAPATRGQTQADANRAQRHPAQAAPLGRVPVSVREKTPPSRTRPR